jgi:hypothetical protein
MAFTPTLHKIMPVALVRDVQTYLQAQGFGTRGTNLFSLRMPSSPVNCIGVFTSGGPDSAAEPLSYARVQLLVRNLDVESCAAQAQNVWQQLAKNSPQFTSHVGRFTADHLPGMYYFDERNYPVFSLNFTYAGLTK